MRPKLETRQEQKLLLTAELQQAIKLLAMPTTELTDLLTQEVVQNPMLEEVHTAELDTANPDEPFDQTESIQGAETQSPVEIGRNDEPPNSAEEHGEQDSWEASDYEYYFGEYLGGGHQSAPSGGAREIQPLENALSVSTQSSLTEHLEWQLSSLNGGDHLIHDIGSAIIGNLNQDGYLGASIDEIAAMKPWTSEAPEAPEFSQPAGFCPLKPFSRPVEDRIAVERALEVVQSFDPVGVAARDLQECLLLQIRNCELRNTPSEIIVRDHFDLLHNQQVPELSRRLGLPIEKLKSHVNEIRQLYPEPGTRHNPFICQHVTPDVYVHHVENQNTYYCNDCGHRFEQDATARDQQMLYCPLSCRYCEACRHHYYFRTAQHTREFRYSDYPVDADSCPKCNLPVERRDSVRKLPYEAQINERANSNRLRISPIYRKLVNNQEQTEETRTYVKEKLRAALWLLKSVDQRQETIQRVARSIASFQSDFLDRGIEYLRPLVLREVADDIGVHESTVSRAVNHKYIHTPQGVFEMKFFFHSGISNTVGDSISSVAVKQKIRTIIQNEDHQQPLSDSGIDRILRGEGLLLARRTIAKYREELKIPPSNRRKVLI